MSIKLRRSIFASKNIKKGEKFSYKNIDTLRPKIVITTIFKNLEKIQKNIKKDSPTKKNSF